MKRTKPPKNSAKQILKLYKHFYTPMERWWELPLEDGSFLSKSRWDQGVLSLARVSSIPRSDWNEKELFGAVKLTNTAPYSAFKKQKMQEYQRWYQPIIEQGIQEALADSEKTERYFLGQLEFSFHFKALTSVKISERKAPVLSDCYISRSGIVVFLKTKTYFSTRGRFPKEIRSAYRSGYAPLRGSRIRMAWYYRDKSAHNRILFSFTQKTTEGQNKKRLEEYAQYLLDKEIGSFERAILLAGIGGLLQRWDNQSFLLEKIGATVEEYRAEIQISIFQRWLDFSAEINQRLQRGEWFDLIFHSYVIELGAVVFLGLEKIEQNLLLDQIQPNWIVLSPFAQTLKQMYPIEQDDIQYVFVTKIELLSSK